MITQAQQYKFKILIMTACLGVLFTIAGCSGNKYDKGLKVFPVLNNQAANSYIAADHGVAAVIDPSDPERISAILTQQGLKLKIIILTHGHFDHILGVDSLISRFPEVKVLIHPSDEKKLADPEKNVSSLFGKTFKSMAKSSPVKEGDIIVIGNERIRVIETPGHTQGSIVLLAGNMLFSGDTVFKGSIGRTDFPGGSNQDLSESLKKIISLSGDLIIYPGHGEITSLQDEKDTNPYLR